ncbi:small integral membrane protein 19 isoform X2 [Pygocentrus nattereri]|uniref:Small integral membrane protein 19 n=1 Tax=Pygocentrus nattereri TaxID=42514 RepID=A0A3B4D5U2_PYGNA|nr:small integral membrane protein 19 isoform X2 [Pygocentrus nattereri]XP_037396193.1 small integral membrane protein 19 isoform X2 [Pygocentrus nattereri]
MGGYGVMANEESVDYSVHEAWNEATNVYLLVILVSFALLMYARKNKRKIMRIFTMPPTVAATPEPNFYDSLQKVRLRQQLEMYSLARKFDQQHQQAQAQESVQLSMETPKLVLLWRW